MTKETKSLCDHADPVVHQAVALVEAGAEIIENYMPPFPTPGTKPRVVVRCGEWFLRYSKGPHTGTFWDAYGDDFQSVDLARSELSNAPPVRTGKPYIEFKLDAATGWERV